MDYGKLNIHVVSDNSGFPIPDATVQITSENEPENIIEEAEMVMVYSEYGLFAEGVML